MTSEEHTYRCDLCGDRFETEDQLRDHWDRTHERETVAASERTS
jgi:hypothetical protein